jgi:creatinine amidohydrolase
MRKRKHLRWVSLGCASALIALSMFTVSAEPTDQPEISSRGYSIFDETLVDMSWPEVEKLANPETLVLFPTGVIEQHGPHMSLGTDVYGAYIQSKLLRRELEGRGIKAVITPPFYWGINAATGSWPGSFSSRPSTIKAVLWDALASLKRWGFQNVVFVNHHGDPDHNRALIDAMMEARMDTGIRAYLVTTEFNAKRWNLLGRNEVLIQVSSPPPAGFAPTFVDRHAGAGETNTLAYYFPSTVNAQMARELPPTEVTWEGFQTWLEGWTVSRGMTPQGYVGDPARFDANKGKADTEATVKRMADVIQAFVKGTYKPGDVMKK